MRLEPNQSESSADSDQDFDPSAEMLVNDFDDEHTLEEEEAMESAESVTNELDDLQREGEMPLNELLAMYGYESESAPSTANGSSTSKGAAAAVVTAGATATPKENLAVLKPEPQLTSSLKSSSSSNSSLTVVQAKEALPVSTMAQNVAGKENEEEDDDVAEVITVPDDPPESSGGTGPLLRSVVCQASETSDTGTDDDYSPDEDWRKTIQVGSDYQATVPEGLCKYDDAPAYENEDRLLWDPSKLEDEQVEEYLRQSQQPFSTSAQGVNAIPVGSHIRDDEQALYLLLQCGHNLEEALRRRRMQPLHPAGRYSDKYQGHSPDTMSLWSEEECRSFETGLKTYGKDFHLIQLNKVRTRSVGELVQFYYLWKKTERHDVFASRNRLEKKKYALHPGTTDYMDRFLDEQENPSSHRDRSSSPSIHSLMFGDKKRLLACSPPATITKMDEHSQTGSHVYHDTFYPMDKTGQLHSQGKGHPSSLLSDCNKDLLNGQERLSSIGGASSKGSSASNTAELPHHSSSNYPSNPSMYSERSTLIPPSEMLSCTRRSNESSRLSESRNDSCNSRFDTCREVTSIE